MSKPTHSQVKQAEFKRHMQHVHSQLPRRDRLASRTVHQSFMGFVLEVMAATIGRTSGLLWAGWIALIGSALYWLFCWYFDYAYQSAVFIWLLLIGYIVGLLVGAFRRPRS